MPLDLANETITDVNETPVTMLYKWERERPDEVFLNQPRDGQMDTYTWRRVAAEARCVAARLNSMNLAPNSRIAIFAKNSAEWFICDLGIMMAGHVSVPIFGSAGKNTIEYVLRHADVKLVFVGKLDNPEEQIPAIPEHYHTVYFPYDGISGTQSWQDFLDCEPMSSSPEPNPGSMMTIIYTSGSTGQPKGVVHTYQTICWAAKNSLIPLSVVHSDRLMSYLPLAHITERVLVELAAFYSAPQIYFVESLETFQRDVQTCEPTLFISVPRLWTKFQMGVLAKIPQKRLNFLLSVPVVKGLIAKKIRQGLGLDKARFWASGSAPLAPAVIRWFHSIGINISEGWGMTENSAYGTASLPFREDKIGTIGKAYDGVDIRISDDSEIQVKSPCNMIEYYLEPEKTLEAMTTDGYLKTGDKGAMDSEGFIRITGRLKDIFKTEKGKYVTPAPIEAAFMENPLIEQVCVTGTNLPQPIALLVLSESAENQDRGDVESSLKTTLEQINRELESHQRVDHVVVLDEPWTIENGLLTPTLKVKRHVLESRYEDLIQARFDSKVEFIDM
ncbi:AMP-binding protein [Salinimonas chungwhensis]|uniref:AMP-binding protein n=1 Tax=Salinimonas chungwhensis TaxID=265425 RepID=UPI0003672BD7|nr:AMP-binding protein [Salinimonas chungwhensis]